MNQRENIAQMFLREIRNEMATKNGISEVKSLGTDMPSDVMTVEKRLGDRINYLNRAVMEYHSSAIGHGVLFSEIDERLRRVERHLKLPPNEAH